MRKLGFSLLIFFSSISVFGHAFAQETRPPVKPIQADKIVLVGDSTTAVLGGWGPSFCAKHVTSFLACVNLARGGRSSYNYRAEGSWDIVEREMRSGGYRNVWVLVQFGHNDQPGKPGRSTDLATEFPANLRRYVEEIRAAGAHPVLLTPLTRRQFKDGLVIDDLAPWADAVRKVAHELNVPLVDLHARSRDAVQGMGPVQAMRFAQMPPVPEQVSAAQKGTTIGHAPTPAGGSQVTVGQTPATPQDNAAAADRLARGRLIDAAERERLLGVAAEEAARAAIAPPARQDD